MAPLKKKGDLAELKVATDLMERGFGIAVPWGENSDFDLIAYRDDEIHRVQVKHAISHGSVVPVRCLSNSLTNGKVRKRKRYTARTIDVHASELGAGRNEIRLRLTPCRNNQKRGVRDASDYKRFGRDAELNPRQLCMEPAGFEPATSNLQS